MSVTLLLCKRVEVVLEICKMEDIFLIISTHANVVFTVNKQKFFSSFVEHLNANQSASLFPSKFVLEGNSLRMLK
jgi:hypothetical protein